MQCPRDICVVIELGELNRGSNPRARSQMRDRVNFFTVKQVSHRRAIAKIDMADGHVLRKTGNVRALDLWVVEIVEIVKDDDGISGRKQLVDKVRPDKPRTACDQNSHETKLATDGRRWTQILRARPVGCLCQSRKHSGFVETP